MVKFAAPSKYQGELAGWSVTGRWTTLWRDPEPRGDVGTELYEYAHHYEPAASVGDQALAVERALWEWRDWRLPDSVTVDAVYASQLSPSAGSQDDPFLGLEGTGSSGLQRSRRSKERGGLGDGVA